MTKATPKVTSTHDYIRVAFGNNRNLSCSHSGEKASGAVPEAVFALWSGCLQYREDALAQIGLTKNTTNGEIVEAFVKHIDTIWPDWNVAPVVPGVGATVRVNFGKRKGIDEGVVEKVRGTMLSVRFKQNGIVSVPADMLEK